MTKIVEAVVRGSFLPSDMGFGNRTLTVTNIRVRGIARKMRWSPEKLVIRVENSLTSLVEQQVYLEVGLGYRIHPESLRKMLEVFREGDSLRDIDRDWFTVGPNMVKSRFSDVIDKVEQALLLIDKTSDASDCMMSMESAAYLVEVYGDHAESMLSQIVDNTPLTARLLEIKTERPRVIVGVAVRELVKVIKQHTGSPFPLTIEEAFSHVELNIPRRINE